MSEDELLARAALAEAKLIRRGLAAVPPPEEPGESDEAGADITILEEPNGSVSWGLRFLPNLERSVPSNGAKVANAVIDGIAKAVPQVAEALRHSKAFELIGPAKALEGLRKGTLELVPTKDGVLGGIRKVSGKKEIVHQGRFRRVKLSRALGPGMVMVAASAVLGHLHMVEIRRQLASIEGKVDRVLEAQQADRHGKVFGPIKLLGSLVMAGGSGELAPQEQNQLGMVELGLLQIASELEQLHRAHRLRSDSLSTSPMSGLAEHFNKFRRAELDDARLYMAACSGLFVLAKLKLAQSAGLNDPSARAMESARECWKRLSSAETTVLSYLWDIRTNSERVLRDEKESWRRFFGSSSSQIEAMLIADTEEVVDVFRGAATGFGEPGSTGLNVIRVEPNGSSPNAHSLFLPEPTDPCL